MAKKLALGSIRTDGGTQVRVELDQDTFLDYGRQMKAGAKFPPVDVFFDGSEYWLADGFHRFYGARESGLECIEAKVHNGTVRDAILFAIGANATHGKPRSNKDKRHAVEMLLADDAWREWSDVKLAEMAAVSNGMVSGIRKELCNLQGSDQPDTTLGKDGKRRHKPRKRNIPTPTFIDDEPDDDQDEDSVVALDAEQNRSAPLPAEADQGDGDTGQFAWWTKRLSVVREQWQRDWGEECDPVTAQAAIHSFWEDWTR